MSRYAKPMSQVLAEMRMNDPKLLKIFDKLKPKDTIQLKVSSAISKGKGLQPYTVRSKNTLRNGVEKITMILQGNPTGVKRFLYKRDGKVTFAIGDMAASIDDIKENLEEGYEKEVLNVLDDAGIDGYFRNGKLYVDKRDAKAAKSALEDADNIIKLPKMVKEEVEDLDEASARADAMRAMGRRKKVDPADVDEPRASAIDKASADKNMVMQMRKVLDVKGNMPIEFGDGKKEKVDPKIVKMMLTAHDKIEKPRDKEKFLAMISKSKRDMLNVAKKLSTLKMELDKEDEPLVKKVVDMLKKASNAHAGQAKDLEKAIKETLDIKEGTWKMPDNPKEVAALKKLMSRPLPIGNTEDDKMYKDSASAKLYGLLGDDELFDALGALEDKGKEKADARPVIIKWFQQRAKNNRYDLGDETKTLGKQIGLKMEYVPEGNFSKEYEDGQFRKGDEKPFVDAIKKGGGKNIDVQIPSRREPMLNIEFDGGDMKKIKSLVSKVGDGTEGLDEGKMKQFHMMMDDGKSAEEIAKALKLDLKTVKSLMKEGYKPVKANHYDVKIQGVKKKDVNAILKYIKVDGGNYDIEDVDADQVTGGGMSSTSDGDIFIQGDDAGKLGMEIAKKFRGVKVMGEGVELDEKYDLYHKTFSDAMQHAYDYAKKKLGITVDPKEIDNKVATGPKKPSEGKTNKYRLKGKGGNLQIQVYNKGGSKPFELNMYKEEFELDERDKKFRYVRPMDRKFSDTQKSNIQINREVQGLYDRIMGKTGIKYKREFMRGVPGRKNKQTHVIVVNKKDKNAANKAVKNYNFSPIEKEVFVKQGHFVVFAVDNLDDRKSWYKEGVEMTEKLTDGNLSLKETVLEMWKEAVSPAQQAAIAISKKEKEKEEGNAFGAALKAARDNGDDTFMVSGKKYKVEDYKDTKEKKLDPVGKEDGDIDNDGDKDATDKYLAKRRKAISKAIKKDKKESFERYHETKQGSLRDAVLQMWGEEIKEKKTLTKEKKDGIKKMTDTGKEVTPVEMSPKMPKVKESKNKV